MKKRTKIIIGVFAAFFVLDVAGSFFSLGDSAVQSNITTDTSEYTTNDVANTELVTVSPPNEPTVSPSHNDPIEYDALQQLYLDIDSQMSYSEMLDLVKSTDLPYSEELYNGSRVVQVAFTEGCTAQKYRKEAGDYLEIIYDYPLNENSSNDILDKYSFATCVYVPNDCTLTLICHESGYYFSYSEPGNYISKQGNDLELDKSMSKEDQLTYYFAHRND